MTPNLRRIEHQIWKGVNLKFVEDFTSNLLSIEDEIFVVMNLKFVEDCTSNLLSIEAEIFVVMNLKFWSIEPQISEGLKLKFVEY